MNATVPGSWLAGQPDDLEPLCPVRPYADVTVADGPLPDPGPFLESFASPATPEVSPAAEFASDFRDLPLFRVTARFRGWCGMAMRAVWRPCLQPPAAELQVPAQGAFLRAVDQDGRAADQRPLGCLPTFAGVAAATDGTLFAGVALHADQDGHILADSADPAYWRAWIEAGHAALAGLTAGGGR